MRLPPPVIHSAKLVAYAINTHDVRYTDKINLYVSGAGGEFVRLGEVPKISICVPYHNEDEFLVFLSDENWVPLGTLVGVSLENAKQIAQRGYEGISGKWQESPYSETAINDFLLDHYGVNPKTRWWTQICSFCGKTDVETEHMIMRDRASICVDCINEFYLHIHPEDV